MSTPADPRELTERCGACSTLGKRECWHHRDRPAEQDPRDALVASPHWEWLPGMLDVEGGRLLELTSDGKPATWHVSACDGLVDEDDLPNGEGEQRTPDLSDPATCGCMLGLVRKAWAGQSVEIVILDDGTAVVEIRDSEDGHILAAESRDTLGLALAAALLAAPARVTGGLDTR